jgi:xanthine dehydrogenase accessory factor
MPRPPDLHDTLAELDSMTRTERRAALATLVSTEGTTPKKAGATMWVGEGGRILGSVTIGGCVDAQVVASSETVLATGRPTLLSLTLRDEEGWDLGLTCGGTLRVLIEPVRLDHAAEPIITAYGAVRRAVSAGRRAIAVAQLPGTAARLVIEEDGAVTGTLGDGRLDAAARAQAPAVFARGSSSIAPVAGSGTSAELFYELYAPPPRLLVFGATHVAMPLVAYATVLGWRATVIDARDRFATRERFPDAEEILVGNVGSIAESQRYDASTHVVIVTHDYKFELPILRTVLAREAAYVGLLAGRKRAQALREFLAADGVDSATFDRIHVPIGLDIGAQTAAEIALGILAEIVAVRTGRG